MINDIIPLSRYPRIAVEIPRRIGYGGAHQDCMASEKYEGGASNFGVQLHTVLTVYIILRADEM